MKVGSVVTVASLFFVLERRGHWRQLLDGRLSAGAYSDADLNEHGASTLLFQIDPNEEIDKEFLKQAYAEAKKLLREVEAPRVIDVPIAYPKTPAERPLRWTDPDLGDMYVKPGEEWVNVGAVLNGKRMAWGWSLKQKRWARRDVPPEGVLRALQIAGWSEIGDGATEVRQSRVERTESSRAERIERPAPIPAPEPLPPQKKRTTHHDLPPPSMAVVEEPDEGSIIVVEGKDDSTYYLYIVDKSVKDSRRFVASSRTVNGGRIFSAYNAKGLVEAPDFTWGRIAGTLDRKLYDNTRQIVLRGSIGGYLVRYFLQETGIPFASNARIYVVIPSGYRTKYIDVTGDPSIDYIPLEKDESLASKAVKPRDGDLLWDHNGTITLRGPHTHYIASTYTQPEGRIFEAHLNDDIYSGIAKFPAPDLTEANIRKWGMRILQKYLTATQEKIDSLTPMEALEIASKGYRVHEHTQEKAQSPHYKKPVTYMPGPETRLLFTSKASHPWEDVTAGTESGRLEPVPVPKRFVDPEGELGPLADPQKLRALADGMENKIQEKLHPAISMQRVTARRAGIGEGMRQEGEGLQKVQSALRTLANAIETKTAPKSLLRIASRAAIEDVLSPYQTGIDKEGARSLLRWSADDKGVSAERRIVEKWVDSYGTQETPALYSAILGLAGTKHTGLGVCLAAQRCKRLARAGLTNERERTQAHSDLKFLLSTQGVMREKTPEELRQRKIADIERALIGRKIAGYFPTPKALVEDLIEQADLRDNQLILEPSAGKGAIADGVRAVVPSSQIDVVEPVGDLREILKMKGYNLVDYDFLGYSPGRIYDRIVMNPPFEDYQDVDHVLHAYSLLKPGGRLVAIMSEGPFFRSDKKGVAWRNWLDEHGESYKNPEGSFLTGDRSTGVATRTVTVRA